MYCSHCGYHLSEEKIDKQLVLSSERSSSTKMVYVCPRCGKIIKEDLSQEEVKDLSRAAHAEIHRARNLRNSGMCFLVISAILLVIAFMFYLMSFKANQGGKLVTDSTEFIVFLVILVLGLCALGYSIFNLVRGYKKNKRYSSVLKDIQNGVFVQ